jgi:hypothetical protein
MVGKNLMAVSLPKTALFSQSGLAVPLNADIRNAQTALALYLPADADPIIYAPNYTCDGMSFKGVESSPIFPGDPDFP